MKRILLSILAAIAVAIPMVAFTPTASAAPVISNGIAWTPNASLPPGYPGDKPLSDYCTMAVVGTDRYGNKVGISAAHCVSIQGANYAPDGAPVYRWTPNNAPREQIGTIAHRSWNGTGYPVQQANSNNVGAFGIDWVVIKLRDDAILTSNGPGVRIDGVGSSNPGGVMCKDGQSTGVTCGWITGQTGDRIFNLAVIGPGDSGGPAYQGTKIVGMSRSWNGLSFEYVKFTTALHEINTNPWPVGKGFVVTNN